MRFFCVFCNSNWQSQPVPGKKHVPIRGLLGLLGLYIRAVIRVIRVIIRAVIRGIRVTLLENSTSGVSSSESALLCFSTEFESALLCFSTSVALSSESALFCSS